MNLVKPYSKSLSEQYEKSVAAGAKVFMDAPWENKLYYGLWLGEMYHFLCHASRVIALAGANFGIEDDVFHFRCMQHAAEEKAHERLALSDLRKLGFDLNDFPEMPSIAQFYHSIYYLIEREDPICLFGSVLYLEGLSTVIGTPVTDRLVKQYGRDASTFMIVHVEEDTGHAGEGHADKALKTLESLSAVREARVCKAMAIAEHSYNQFMYEIADLALGDSKVANKGRELSL
ncbi:MAG: hypothetical protein COT74_02545 [Bdellovibrionales bacterium CG10_big_fil_rev_8_21_14_0_10_45_34]|nr:MAG: hypothetical protein COT74_02545 [Bdellovibrionales bacterium CG10_big_fil_rev_8_21_14_0_10_45_34]